MPALSPIDRVAPATERTDRETVFVWSLLVHLIGAAPVVSFFALPRDFSAPELASADVETLLLLKVRGVVVLAAIVGAIAWLLATGRARPGGWAICATGLLFTVATVVSGILGLEPRLRGTMALKPAMFVLLFLLPPISQARLGRWVERIVLFHAWAAMLVAVVAPERVLQPSYSAGWLSLLPFRLHGIGIHANGLGPLMVAYFIARWFVGTERRGMLLRDAAPLVVLVAAQSKMAWAIFLLCGALAVTRSGRLRLPWARFPLVGLTILLTAALTDMSDSAGIVGNATGLLPSSAQAQAYTLTGRTQVWRETLYLWEQNPWFGYGPGLWDRDMQERYRDVLGWEPPSSHSQFYQTLGESGLVGISTLLLYLATLTISALRSGARHPVNVAFAILIIARGITEATLAGNLEAAFMIHFWTVAFLVLASRARRRAALA